MTPAPDNLLARLDALADYGGRFDVMSISNICAEAAARIRELEAMVAWRGIEAAPKDRPILAYQDGLMRVVQHMTAMMDPNDTAWVYARELGLDGVSFALPAPTHWQPVPPPPVTE